MNPIDEEDDVDVESHIGSHTGIEEHSSDHHKTPEIASRETRWVNYSKVLVVAVILIMAAAMGVITYQFVSSQETNDYEQQVSRSLSALHCKP